MNIAYVYAVGRLFLQQGGPLPEARQELIARMKRSGRHRTSSRAMIMELQHRGLLDAAEGWRFWNLPTSQIDVPGRLPLRLFSATGDGAPSDDLSRHVAANGQPQLLWIEGRHFPPNLHQVIALCPRSLKLHYSQNWRPWEIEGLDRYDLCLVDEERHVAKVQARYPALRCAVWDKLIDYEGEHRPLGLEKRYDLCYVADLRPRKAHELLLHAMARLRDRKLSTVCVGADHEGRIDELRGLAQNLGVDVEFTGEIGKEQVNEYVNRSRIGVVCAKRDAAPRVILEYMASDVPVLVNAELRAGVRYVGARAGLSRPPERFHEGIVEILDAPERFAPRAHLLEHYSRDQVVERFLGSLADAGVSLG